MTDRIQELTTHYNITNREGVVKVLASFEHERMMSDEDMLYEAIVSGMRGFDNFDDGELLLELDETDHLEYALRKGYVEIN